MNDDTRTDLIQAGQSPRGTLDIFGNRDSFDFAQRAARLLSASKFVPEVYRGDDGLPNCLIALDLAARMNTSPMAVIQNLNIIEGRPSFASKFLIGTVNQNQSFGTLHYTLKVEKETQNVTWTEYQWDEHSRRKVPQDRVEKDFHNISCFAWAIDRETGETLEGPLVDLVMAIQERWFFRRGSKWQTMPSLMLRYRAASMWVSVYAPETAMGFPTQEEARDIIDITPTDAMGYRVPHAAPDSDRSSIDELNATVADTGGAKAETIEPEHEPELTEEPKPELTEEPEPTEKPETEQVAHMAGEQAGKWPQGDHETGELVDSDGLPFNPTYHSGGKKCNDSDGRWRIRRGVDRSKLRAWEIEQEQLIAARKRETDQPEVEQQVPEEEAPVVESGLNLSPEFLDAQITAAESHDDLDEVEDLLSSKEVQDDIGEPTLEDLVNRLDLRRGQLD